MFSIINIKWVTLVAISYAVLDCQTPKRTAKKQKKPAGATLISDENLYGEEIISPLKNSPKPMPKNSVASASKQPEPTVTPLPTAQTQPKANPAPSLKPGVLEFKDNCNTLVQRFAPYYQSLIADLSPAQKAAHHARLAPIINMKVQDCNDEAQLPKTLASLRSIATSHKLCVGMILPLTGGSHKATSAMMRGFQAAFQDLKPASLGALPWEQVFRVRDSGGSPTQAKKWFAELTLVDQCGLIVGGLDHGEASQLVLLSQGIQQPLLLLSSRTPIPPEATSVYSLFPSEFRLAQTLVQGAFQKSIKKVALLRPSGGKSDRLIDQFKTEFKASGGQILEEVVYTSGQFETLQTATRKLFRTDIIGREMEYKEALLRARKKADLAKEKFNPKMVLLRPQVNFDALFIPDDFRSVRHIVKLIKYHMVDKLILFGNHEWRSQGLLSPAEPFLDGAFFVDFVPRYDQIPKSLPVSLDGSPYFAAPQEVAPMDFKLIGYHAGRVLLKALEQSPPNRLAYVPVLKDLKVSDTKTSPLKPAFDGNRRALWPTYAYGISQGGIQMMNLQGSTFAAAPK